MISNHEPMNSTKTKTQPSFCLSLHHYVLCSIVTPCYLRMRLAGRCHFRMGGGLAHCKFHFIINNSTPRGRGYQSNYSLIIFQYKMNLDMINSDHDSARPRLFPFFLQESSPTMINVNGPAHFLYIHFLTDSVIDWKDYTVILSANDGVPYKWM